MAMWLPSEPDDFPWEKPDETDECQLGISPQCTEEGAYQWGKTYCCAHCLSMAEKAMESNRPPVLESDQVRR